MTKGGAIVDSCNERSIQYGSSSPTRFIRLFVQNPIIANLLMIAIIVLGSLAFIALPRELMSKVSFNWVFLYTAYPSP